ncbi:MAG: vitamin B12 dependent-methionine synthase activation domain-containing protein [Candidatus Neomarinimicrobiota bacterium]
MSRTFTIELTKVLPERQAVLREQGIPTGADVPDRILALFDQAMDVFSDTDHVKGITIVVSRADFDRIFTGQGANDPDAPLMKIYSRAHNLALFALTLGKSVSSRIEQLFAENNFALGNMLDSIASLAAERAIEQLEQGFAHRFAKKGHPEPEHRSLSYSPGYCGWDISGQKALFDTLTPDEIGITLNRSFLMTPLKSVSGVLVEGSAQIHEFDPKFSFCRVCRSRSCVLRMRRSSNMPTATN